MNNFRKEIFCFNLFLFIAGTASLIFYSGCSAAVLNKEPQKFSFYELCFAFPKLPENTGENDIKTASSAYEKSLLNKGITVLKRRNTANSVCYFIDSMPDFSVPNEDVSNNISKYLLTAYFKKEYSSLYGVFPTRKKSVMIHDKIPLPRKLPLYVEKKEGIVITGSDSKLLFIARYLDILNIEHDFGFNGCGAMVINILPDLDERWKMIPFLSDSLELEDFVSQVPGDFALLDNCRKDRITLKLLMPSWELSPVPVARDIGLGNEDALVFSVSVMSLPFDEETLLKFFYTLSNSYLLPPSSGLYYSPNFKGSGVKPMVLLFSSEFSISGEYSLSPEMIYMWVSSVNRQLESYPDDFYANLLSLKIARKIYSGTPSFLGGNELVNTTSAVPFEKIREMLFHKGNITVFGSVNSSLYLFSEDIISEFGTVIDASKSIRVKAFYGSPENSDRSIITFVTRSANAEVLTNKIGIVLLESGFIPFQTLFEQVSLNDSWGSVTVSIPKTHEKKILDLYEKNFKLLNNTVSVGVYRVQKEE